MRSPGRRRLALAGLTTILLGIVLAALLEGPGPPRGSVLSRGGGGWLAARRYLEARGVEVKVLSQPLASFEGRGVLVVSFPWQLAASLETADHLEDHLRRGGDLVLAYSGVLNASEWIVLEGLGLPPEEVRRPPLSPLAFRRFAREEWALHPVPTLPGETAPVRVWAPRWVPAFPKQARALFRAPGGTAAVAVLPRYRGRLWVLPVDAFANSRLGQDGNAGLLETLLRRLPGPWTFDEYHHGLAGPRSVETAAFGRTLDLILIHLAVLYLAALLTLARRFGPPWREPPVVTGSAGSFLLGLGALHHRLGHHREAAKLLLARVRDLEPGLALPEDLVHRAETAGPRDLVALAATVARLRRGDPPPQDGRTDA